MTGNNTDTIDELKTGLNDLRLGSIILLDVGIIGLKFYESLSDYFLRIRDFSEDSSGSAMDVYSIILGDLVRIMKKEPMGVLEEIKYFPYSDSIHQVIVSIDELEYSELMVICQEHVLELYLHLRPQILFSQAVMLIPDTIGTNYISVKEVMDLCSLQS